MYQRMNTNQNSELLKSYAINEIVRKYPQTRIRERTGDEVEIEVPLKISKSKGALWILVILPQSYPQTSPVIQVINASVKHEFIDDNFRVHHPTLSNWSTNSSLLACVEKVNSEFDSTPPQLAKHGKNNNSVNAGTAPKHKSKALKLRKPALSDLENKIKDMSSSEIQGVLDDDTFFEDFFMNLEGVRDFYDDFVKILMRIKSKAEENMVLKEEVEENTKEIEDDDDEIDFDEINDKMDEKIQELKDETDKMKKDFKKAKMETEDFIEEYKEAKKKLLKYEMMKHKIEQDS
jgi:hypothetical protein